MSSTSRVPITLEGMPACPATVGYIEDVLQAHIHLAPEGVNGPIVAWLNPSGPPPMLIPGRSDGILATGVILEEDLVGPLAGMSLDDLVAAMRAGLTYVKRTHARFWRRRDSRAD